jgi:hypothetical protein
MAVKDFTVLKHWYIALCGLCRHCPVYVTGRLWSSQRSDLVSLLKARAWNLCRAKVQSATSHLPCFVLFTSLEETQSLSAAFGSAILGKETSYGRSVLIFFSCLYLFFLSCQDICERIVPEFSILWTHSLCNLVAVSDRISWVSFECRWIRLWFLCRLSASRWLCERGCK